MAVLDNGIWHPDKEEYELSIVDSFQPPEKAKAGRYHLYMSLACPFAHRPYLVINYLGLQDTISVSSVAPERYEDGWLFDAEYPDNVNGATSFVALHQKASPTYSGKATVPVLWDKQENTIVCNDSASLAMDFATNWLPLAKNQVELVPNQIKDDILELNSWLHNNVNRKVYNVGFAKDQASYDAASEVLFNALEQLDSRLGKSQYLHDESITLSDLFLLPTLVRFEAVYEVHFKANKKPIQEFKNLYQYMLDFMAIPVFRETVDIDYMKRHYYISHRHINPTGIVPSGPEISW
ncbi:MAG: glutathione S-transferase C-terminal domain-containing protein [Bermanella sp.]